MFWRTVIWRLSGTPIGTLAVPVKANLSGNLSLTTTTGDANIVLATSETLATSGLTLSIASGRSANVTVGTLNVDANIGVSTSDVSFTTTTGGITGGSLITGGNITLVSKTGIRDVGERAAQCEHVQDAGGDEPGGELAGIFWPDTAALVLTATGLPTTAVQGKPFLASSITGRGSERESGTRTDSLILTAASTGATVTIDCDQGGVSGQRNAGGGCDCRARGM